MKPTDDDVRGIMQVSAARAVEIDRLQCALKEQIAKIDAWATTTEPGNSKDVLLNVGAIARNALQHR